MKSNTGEVEQSAISNGDSHVTNDRDASQLDYERSESILMTPKHMQQNAHLELCEFDGPSDLHSPEEMKFYKQYYRLLYTMMKQEECRTKYLEKDGAAQINCTKSTEGWLPSLWIWKGRALDSVIHVWLAVNIHAIVYTVVMEVAIVDQDYPKMLTSWQGFFSLVLNMTLGLLLVFRLNRAAARWWIAREYWGFIVAKTRSLTGGVLAHGEHKQTLRDECIRWLTALLLSTIELLRGNETLHSDMFAGILSKTELLSLQSKRHPPMYAAEQVRFYLTEIFKLPQNGESCAPTALSNSSVHVQTFLEKQLNSITDYCGGLERVKASPIPMVYVSHLRSFLLISLFLFPYMWGPALGWATIPASAIFSFALLGIESCSSEVEIPFGKSRPNALNMDGYVLGAIGNIMQMMKQQADRKMVLVQNNNNVPC